jgi:predicted SAM-dependent methyltransferase
VKLNLGAGESELDGFIPVDRKTGGEIYPLRVPGVGDVADGSVEAAYASHCLEHFSHTKTLDVLREWVRALKPGGTLQVAVPNADYILSRMRDDPLAELWLFGGHLDENDLHHAMFTERKLRELLTDAGLVDVKPWVSSVDDCAALPVSLNLQGTKPDPKKVKPRLKIPRIVAVLSCPRFGPLDAMENMKGILDGLGIRLGTAKGALWGQCLTRLMDEAVAAGAEWILTLDFDSFFTRQDVIDLMRLMAEHPEADAVAPLQVKRGTQGEILVGIESMIGKTEITLPADGLTRADSMHFGLTLLRVSSLLKMPHPWFHGQPNAAGRWEDGRLDDDIYFWAKWGSVGNTAYIANGVPIGHAEMMVTWPGSDGRPVYQHVGDFAGKGKPAGVRRHN